jgi:N-acetylneuraminic acid mutarotase
MLNTSIATTELYDPATGIWTATGGLNNGRSNHTATLLPNGKVLVTGGDTGLFTTSELYDPATGIWTATGSLNSGRFRHSATLLPNGKVLVAGGAIQAGMTWNPVTSSELYDPATGIWTTTGSLSTGRYYFTATLLTNGKVLVAGSGVGVGNNGNLASSELYDPATGGWTSTGNLNSANVHTATLLPNGTVLVSGGNNSAGLIPSSEIYDPVTGNWSLTGSLAVARMDHTATLLTNGHVLVTGGCDLMWTGLVTSEQYW